jgi:hypothetical protein
MVANAIVAGGAWLVGFVIIAHCRWCWGVAVAIVAVSVGWLRNYSTLPRGRWLGLLTPKVRWTVCQVSICVESYDAGVGCRGCVLWVMWNPRVHFASNVEFRGAFCEKCRNPKIKNPIFISPNPLQGNGVTPKKIENFRT